MTEFSVEHASPANSQSSLTQSTCHAQNAPNPASVEILRRWDRMNANPSYKSGKETLRLWLNSGFPALDEGYVDDGNFKLETPIRLDDVLLDSWIAYEKRDRTKLRIWNGVLREIEDPGIFLRILSFRFFQGQSITAENPNESSCLSVFDMKATKKGILTFQPMLLESIDSYGSSHKIVCQKKDQKFVEYSRIFGARKSQRISTQVKREASADDDWELVYSQKGAISGFHFDSSGSGRFLHLILGTKVLCACPCSPSNWEVFQPYYKNMHGLQERQLFYFSIDNRLADLTMKLRDIRVAILCADDSIMIPPGWIHAVITVEESFMIDIYVFRDGWTEMIRQASKLELSFCLCEGPEILKKTNFNEILARYQDFISIRRLSETVGPEQSEALTSLAEEKLCKIKMIERLIRSNQKMSRVVR